MGSTPHLIIIVPIFLKC